MIRSNCKKKSILQKYECQYKNTHSSTVSKFEKVKVADGQMMKIAIWINWVFFESHSWGAQWTEKGGQEQFSDAESILSQRYVEYVGPSRHAPSPRITEPENPGLCSGSVHALGPCEIWIFLKKFVLVDYFSWNTSFLRHFFHEKPVGPPPQLHRKDRVLNFDLKLYTEKVSNTSSLFWK